MNSWYELNMFTRIMFVIGFLVSIAIFGGLCGALACFIDIKLSRRQAQKKSNESKLVDLQGIDFTAYDNKARIKRQGHELRKITYRKKASP